MSKSYLNSFQECFRDPPIVPGDSDLNFREPVYTPGPKDSLDRAWFTAIVVSESMV